MNWKFNAWTVLFAFTLLGFSSLFFVNSCTPVENTETKDQSGLSEKVENLSPLAQNCPGGDPLADVISDSIFVQDTARYGAYLRDPSSVNVANPDVIYFSMKPCEIYDMAQTMTWNTTVTAHLAIKQVDGQNQIIVHFRGEKYVAPGTEASGGGMLNYDFTRPCPDLCPNG